MLLLHLIVTAGVEGDVTRHGISGGYQLLSVVAVHAYVGVV